MLLAQFLTDFKKKIRNNQFLIEFHKIGILRWLMDKQDYEFKKNSSTNGSNI